MSPPPASAPHTAPRTGSGSKSPRRWRTRLRQVLPWAAGAYLLAAFSATHMPLSPGGYLFPHFDKMVHTTIFAGLSLLVAAWRTVRFDPPRRAAAIAFVLCLTYAAADELTQTFTPNREANPWDFLADTVGTLVGLAAFLPLIRWWRRHV